MKVDGLYAEIGVVGDLWDARKKFLFVEEFGIEMVEDFSYGSGLTGFGGEGGGYFWVAG